MIHDDWPYCMKRVLAKELADWPIPELGRMGLPPSAPDILFSCIAELIPFPVPVAGQCPAWPPPNSLRAA